MEHREVSLFRQYLRLKTVHPAPDYDAAILFLTHILNDIGLDHRIVSTRTNRQILIATWRGDDPSLPTILLNSHTDVVPVFPDKWTHDPFEAVKDGDGRIFGRGAQDMKCVTIQYLEAIRRLKSRGVRLRRTIHLTFMPDEEIGGESGMKAFLDCREWNELNVGFALDEGLANPTDEFTVYYGERLRLRAEVVCHGNPGHASQFIENTAAEKVRRVIDRFLDYRQQEKNRLETNACLTLGDVTTVNLTMLRGGVQINVVPAAFVASFDIRVTPSTDLNEMERRLIDWCTESGDGVEMKLLQDKQSQTLTSTQPGDLWWDAFSSACRSLNMKVKCEIFPAATDSSFLRQLGLPALGFSPMNHTPILLHDNDEFLDEQIFMRGIEIYEIIIPALGNA